MAKKNSSSAYIAALVLFLLGAGYLVFSGLSENSIYFLNVSEALAMPAEQRQAARLFGSVSPEGLAEAKIGSGKALVFNLQDKDVAGNMILVTYKGTIPDTFKVGVEVIVEGNFSPDGSQFSAKSLMTKCPSKYEKENRESKKV